jgi:glycerol-3-phosphate dehydrogenase (NAD+)
MSGPQVINERHENPKYLAGVDLGENVRAVTSVEDTIQDADCIVLCTPHQFVHR